MLLLSTPIRSVTAIVYVQNTHNKETIRLYLPKEEYREALMWMRAKPDTNQCLNYSRIVVEDRVSIRNSPYILYLWFGTDATPYTSTKGLMPAMIKVAKVDKNYSESANYPRITTISSCQDGNSNETTKIKKRP